MSDEAAFLQAILADPDDDTPRLIFADWLEERGDSRGEFIRVQIALADPALAPAEHARLVVRQAGLLAAHDAEWSEPFRPYATQWEFERGFVARVTVEADVFFDQADALFELAPIRHLKIRNVGTRIAQVAASPHLQRLAGLDLAGNGLGDTGAEILVSEARLPRLDELNLGMNFLDIEGVRALATTPHLARLKSLDLDHNHVHDMGVFALASSTQLGSLAHLRLTYGEISSAGARYLAEAKELRRLERLDLSHNSAIGDAGVRALARPRDLRSLQELRLQGSGIGALGARLLAESALAGRLKCLDLRGNAIARSAQEALHQKFGEKVCLF
jgi:uncharacterized protein (TIGR02996 family)